MSTTETQAEVVEGIGVDIIKDTSFSSEQREYLRNRWLHEVRWFAKATRRSRRLYLAVSVVAVFSGALTACTAGLNVFFDDRSIRWLIAGLGVLTAISTGLSGRFQDWENWKRRSMTLERLKSEGRMFQLLAGRYKTFPTRGAAFSSFAENLERIVKEYKTEFFAKRPDQQLEDVPLEKK
jgi:hypothetical protein